MKQLIVKKNNSAQTIVMIATILLGIAIAVVVLGFSGTAETLSSGVNTKITSTFNGYYTPD